MKSFPRDISEFTDWISELRLQNPDLYKQIENHFRFREMDRKLGILLDYNATERGRTGPRVASDNLAQSGPSRDKRTK